MKIIDRYTLKQVIIGFILVLASMTALVWLTQSLRMIDMIVTRGVSPKVFFELTLLILPNFLQVLSPLTLFAVALFTLIRMQSDKELMVMQAVGMSAKDIMRPIFKMAIVLTVFGYVLSFFLVPLANKEMREMKWEIRNNIGHLLLQEGQFNTFKNGLTLYVKERLPDGQVKGVIAYKQKTPDKWSIMAAPNGEVFQEKDGVRVVVYDSVKQEYEPESKKYTVLKSKKNVIMLPNKNSAEVRSTDPRELSLWELLTKTAADVDNNMPKWRKHKVEFVKRFVQPLYNLTYLYLVAFGVLSGFYNRRGQVGKINLTVILALVVQSLALAFENMSNKSLWCLILYVLNVFSPIVLVRKIDSHKVLKWLKACGACLLVLLMMGSANAEPLKLGKTDTKAPVDFEADDVSYNQKTGEMQAQGKVVLTQDTMTLRTERIIYNQNENKVRAPDDIKIEMQDGTVAYTSQGEMSSGLDQIKTGPADVHFYEGTILTSQQMERVENGDSYLTEATYTPCDVCKGEAPLWQLRAKTVRHDSESKDLVYENVFLDVKDVPVFYAPYWRMPDPTVKRRTGFLAPGIYSTHEMRRSLSLPFFVNIADNQNLIIRPIIAVDHAPLGIATYKGIFNKGYLNMSGSATHDDDPSRDLAHFKGDFAWNMTDKWKLSGQLYRTSSDTYFKRYDLDLADIEDTDPYLTSHLTAERFGNRNYFKAKAYSFQTLLEGADHDAIPQLIPTVEYDYNTAPLNDMGLYGFSKINSALYNTRRKFKSNRVSLTQGISMPYVSSWGGAFDMTGYVRADGYSVDTGKDSFAGQDKEKTYDRGRVYPNLSVTAKYPLIYAEKNATQTLEPTLMLVTAPNSGNSDKIPNVDSLSFDFDDTNLFSSNRFSGYDRVEPGTRLNYGFKWNRFNRESGRSLSALIGQSYRFKDNQMMSDLMGYHNGFSDYVGRAQADFEYMTLLYRTRLDQDSLKVKTSEVDWYMGTNALWGGIGYVKRDSYKIGDYQYTAGEEIVYKLETQLTKAWKASGEYRYDLSGKGEPVDWEAMVQYDNECMAVSFEVDKSYTRDRNYEGETSFMVKLFFKTLGGL